VAQGEYASNQQTALLLAKNLAKFATHLLHALAAVAGEPMDLPKGSDL